MLSNSQALDIPDISSDSVQQARIAALGITIGQFQKTLQGRSLVENQKLFVLGGVLYQGYNQKAVECPEDQCSDSEIGEAYDVDGTRQRLFDTRRRRLDGNANAKDREMAERRKLKVAQERDELELMLLRRRLKAEDAAMEPETEPEPEIDPEVGTFVCDAPDCGQSFSTANKLRGHKVGKKH